MWIKLMITAALLMFSGVVAVIAAGETGGGRLMARAGVAVLVLGFILFMVSAIGSVWCT